jgi:hypothetical protein
VVAMFGMEKRLAFAVLAVIMGKCSEQDKPPVHNNNLFKPQFFLLA